MDSRNKGQFLDVPVYPWFIKGWNIALIMFTAFCVLAGAAVFLSYKHYQATLEKYLKEDRSMAYLLSILFEEHFNRIIMTMESYANRPLLLQAAKEEDEKKALEHLESLRHTSTYIDSLVITDRHGTLWGSSPPRPGLHGKNFSHRDWYRGVSKEWKPYVSEIVRRVVGEKDPAAYIAVPCFDEKGKVVAILVNAQRTAALHNFIDRIPFGSDASITATDRSGDIAYSVRYPVGQMTAGYPFFSQFEKVMGGKKKNFIVNDPYSGGEERHISFATLQKIGWHVFVGRSSRSVFLGEWRQYLQISTIAVLLFLIFCMSLIYFRREVIARQAVAQMAAEKKLTESEIRFSELFHTMTSGVAVYRAIQDGDDFVIVDLNDAAKKITGVDADFAGKHICDVFPGVRDMGFFRVLQRVWRTGEAEFYPTSFYEDDRLNFWVENHVYKLPTDEVVAIFDDVTERKQAEEEIRRLNEGLEETVALRTRQLEALNKELEAFTYSVSHDLRAPLRHISGYIDLLARRSGDSFSEKGKHYMDSIADSARQMGTLIDDLLQFSRTSRQEMRLAYLDMNAVLREVIGSMEGDVGRRGIEWVIATLPHVRGDYSMLRLVWSNLAGNAVKFTRDREKARIEIGFRDGDGEYIFFIRDNGAGFDMQYAHKLFGVFQRLHSPEEFEGTGIGLANARRIIAKHGGRIWAEAESGKGATFYFTLPIKEGENHGQFEDDPACGGQSQGCGVDP